MGHAMRHSLWFVIVSAAVLALGEFAQGQEPAPVVYLPDAPPALTVGVLRAVSTHTAVLPVTNTGSIPLTVRVRPGMVFTAVGGEQSVMAIGSPSLTLAPASRGTLGPSSYPTRLARLWRVKGDVILMRALAPLDMAWSGVERIAVPLGSGLLATASSSPGASGELSIELLCIEPERPDPRPSHTTWHMIRSAEGDIPELSKKRTLLEQLTRGLDLVDAEVARLAESVQIRQGDNASEIEYRGEPLTAGEGHLLRTVDWTTLPDGSTHGVLNHPVVVQFAFWTLTHGYTQSDLTRRLHEERFAFVQTREASLRWSIRYLLERAGFNPDLFEAPPPTDTKTRDSTR